jgi:hypothetical protein
MRKLVYLVQSAAGAPSSYQAIYSDRADLIQLTWKQPIEGALFLPKSTWSQGRNRLLAEAMGRGESYLYYIFLDDDVVFERGDWRAFEDALLNYRPAIATPFFPDYPPVDRSRLDLEAHTCAYFDAMFNAFHADVARDGLILPYYDGFDAESWWYSQALVMELARELYPEHTVQVNSVVIRNTNHADYPHGDDWSKVEQWYRSQVLRRDAPPSALEAVRRKIVGRLHRHLGIHSIPPAFRAPRPPGKPPRTYRISPRDRERKFNPDCPLWRRTPGTLEPVRAP